VHRAANRKARDRVKERGREVNLNTWSFPNCCLSLLIAYFNKTVKQRRKADKDANKTHPAIATKTRIGKWEECFPLIRLLVITRIRLR